ncbi:MAG: hypothetical protein L0G82_13720, partial [Pseudomonas sp.]|nr:hypothetical protein [Pseudomonas sp.]
SLGLHDAPHASPLANWVSRPAVQRVVMRFMVVPHKGFSIETKPVGPASQVPRRNTCELYPRGTGLDVGG